MLESATAFSEADFRPDMTKASVPPLVICSDDDVAVPLEAAGALAAEMVKGTALKV